MKVIAHAIALALTLAACGPEQAPPPETTVQELASAAARLDHGLLPLGNTAYLRLAKQSLVHTFDLKLPAAARVTLATGPDDGGRPVDTVLSLFRRQPSGALKLVERNDDHARTVWSRIERQLPPGDYQLELRGYTKAERGPVVLSTVCDGAGCPVEPPACLFGDTFSELRTSERVQTQSQVWIRDVAQLTDALARDQLVLAVQQSSHDDVTSPEEALSRVDQNEVRLMDVLDPETGRRFTVYEYGAGDNSYGAIFQAGSLTIAASIHDGDLLDCTFTDG